MLTYSHKNDKRVAKAEKALKDAMLSMLAYQSLDQITVRELCDTAEVSRATFYAHFSDKYQLLGFLLSNLAIRIDRNDYAYLEETLNKFVNDNKRVIKNLIIPFNDEVMSLLHDCILQCLNLSFNEQNPKNIVICNFIAGGIESYITWQVKKKFPADLQMMNPYFYDILQFLRDWNPD